MIVQINFDFKFIISPHMLRFFCSFIVGRDGNTRGITYSKVSDHCETERKEQPPFYSSVIEMQDFFALK